jgi:hypothetical protein
MRKRKSLTQHRKEAKLRKDVNIERSSDFHDNIDSLGITEHEEVQINRSRPPSPDSNDIECHQNELHGEIICRDFEDDDGPKNEASDDGRGVELNDMDSLGIRLGHEEVELYRSPSPDNEDNNDFEYQTEELHDESTRLGDEDHPDDTSDDGRGENSYIDCDNAMDNVELAMLTDTGSLDVDKSLVIRLLAILIPLKLFLSTRIGGSYSETKQSNCALRLCNLLVWTALNSTPKKILDESTLLLWMEQMLRSEYTLLDAYCQYLEETKLHAASTIRNYLYDYG